MRSIKIYSIGEFHGDVLEERHSSLAAFAVTRRRAGTFVEEHQHDSLSLIMLLEGRHCWTDRMGKIHWSVPGVWYFREPMDAHVHERCPSDIVCLGCHFNLQEIHKGRRLDSDSSLDSAMGRRLAKQMINELQNQNPNSDSFLMARLYDIIYLMKKSSSDKIDANWPETLQHAKSVMDEDFLSDLSLSSLAYKIGLHPSHLARSFRKYAGVTVGEYIRDRRLEWAYSQLVYTEEKISTIAISAGFTDHAHFCRVFKTQYSKNPSDCRKL